MSTTLRHLFQGPKEDWPPTPPKPGPTVHPVWPERCEQPCPVLFPAKAFSHQCWTLLLLPPQLQGLKPLQTAEPGSLSEAPPVSDGEGE